jgi:hypothetical protein
VFINLFAAQIYCGSFGFDQWKPHALGTGPLTVQDHASHSNQDQLADGTPAGGRLLLELPIERRGDVDSCANRFRFHSAIIADLP